MVSTAINGAIENYVDDEGLLTHEAADTWMDAKIAGELPWSDRGTRAVEIQALWITSLRAGAQLAEMNGDAAAASEWRALADQAEQGFGERFWDAEAGRMADRIREDDSADEKIRPNQYMVISVPFDNQIVDDEVEARLIADSFSHIVYPYGVASLAQDHEYFHPKHENHSYHHKDAAYHNGTIWGWNAGFVVSALTKYGYQHRAYELSSNLADQILNYGTRGSMSENLDALLDDDGDINLTGTYSQAWSVSEYARNTYQDYLGFRPDLLENRLSLTPAIPVEWEEFEARVPFGDGESMEIRYSREGDTATYMIRLSAASPVRTLRFQPLDTADARYRAAVELEPGQDTELSWDSASASLRRDGSSLAVEKTQESYSDILGELPFQTSPPYRPEDYPMLEDRNTLQGIIEAGEYR